MRLSSTLRSFITGVACSTGVFYMLMVIKYGNLFLAQSYENRECAKNEDTFSFSSNENDPMSEIFYKHKGRQISKWTQYIPLYHRHFSKFRGKDINIMEIGLAAGGSLQLWRKYFGPKAKIYGIDIHQDKKR